MREGRSLSTATIWLFAAVLSAAIAIGTLSLGLLLLAGLIPILGSVVLSGRLLAGLGGLATGFGTAWTAALIGALGRCPGDGCTPPGFAILSIAVLVFGLVASGAAVRQG